MTEFMDFLSLKDLVTFLFRVSSSIEGVIVDPWKSTRDSSSVGRIASLQRDTGISKSGIAFVRNSVSNSQWTFFGGNSAIFFCRHYSLRLSFQQF